MKLLVSVRDESEARLAVGGGVDLLDLKEPRNGALGKVAPPIASAVCRLVAAATAGKVPVSAAWGELRDWNRRADAISAGDGLPCFVKIGLAGMVAANDWEKQMAEFGQSLPAGVQPVAAAYADHLVARAPPPSKVLDLAIRLGWPAFLVDTFDKQSGSLLTHFKLGDLGGLVARSREAGLTTVVAGSLDADSIRAIAGLKQRPDFVGVRGAVCPAGRSSTIDAGRIRDIRELLQKIESAREVDAA